MKDGVSFVPLSIPPASKMLPVVSPKMLVASSLPLIVMVITCSVPSIEVTVKASVSVSPTFKPCTVVLSLSSV